MFHSPQNKFVDNYSMVLKPFALLTISHVGFTEQVCFCATVPNCALVPVYLVVFNFFMLIYNAVGFTNDHHS